MKHQWALDYKAAKLCEVCLGQYGPWSMDFADNEQCSEKPGFLSNGLANVYATKERFIEKVGRKPGNTNVGFTITRLY